MNLRNVLKYALQMMQWFGRRRKNTQLTMVNVLHIHPSQSTHENSVYMIDDAYKYVGQIVKCHGDTLRKQKKHHRSTTVDTKDILLVCSRNVCQTAIDEALRVLSSSPTYVKDIHFDENVIYLISCNADKHGVYLYKDTWEYELKLKCNEPFLVLFGGEQQERFAIQHTLSNMLDKFKIKMIQSDFTLNHVFVQLDDAIRNRIEKQNIICETNVHVPPALMVNEELNPKPTCAICMENDVNIMFVPCGHASICSICLYNYQKTYDNCLICRGNIESTMNIFF